MAAERITDFQPADLLSLMRTLAGLTESAQLRGADLSAETVASVAVLLAEVHVAREPVSTDQQYAVRASSMLPNSRP